MSRKDSDLHAIIISLITIGLLSKTIIYAWIVGC